jgi:hypothetical protein
MQFAQERARAVEAGSEAELAASAE